MRRLILPLCLAVAAVCPPGIEGADEIAGSLRPFVERGVLAGAVTLVASPEKNLSLDAVGYSDVVAKTPIKTDAVFWIASQSKPITATALMILVDEGKVKLDDPIAKYLPEFRELWVVLERTNDRLNLKRPDRPVTVRDVLSHMSGMPFKSALEEPTLDMSSLREGAKSYAMTPLQTEPGTKYAYSNAGINTAGRIIEVVCGQKYEDFLQTRLFGPLGMKDTTFWPEGGQLDRIAKAYKPNAAKTGLEETKIAQLTYPLNGRERQPMPAGGLFSTAEDLGRFCRMVLNGGELDGKRYLSEWAVKEMTKRQTPSGVKEDYGLGWATGGGVFGHGGAYATNMSIDPKRKLVTIFLVQHAGFPGDGGKAQGAFREAANKTFGR